MILSTTKSKEYFNVSILKGRHTWWPTLFYETSSLSYINLKFNKHKIICAQMFTISKWLISGVNSWFFLFISRSTSCSSTTDVEPNLEYDFCSSLSIHRILRWSGVYEKPKAFRIQENIVCLQYGACTIVWIYVLWGWIYRL